MVRSYDGNLLHHTRINRKLKANPPIEFVYFDLGNILVSFDPQLACANLSTLLNVSKESAKLALYDSGLQERFEHGQITPVDFAAALCDVLESPSDRSVTESILDAISDMFTPITAMESAIDQVDRCGCRTGILSNTCHAHWDWIKRQDYQVLRRPFDATILSYEVGSMKPDNGIYEVAEEVAGVAADRILFIDDRQENVDAALRRGWNAARCFGGDEAIGVLRSFGLIGGDG